MTNYVSIAMTEQEAILMAYASQFLMCLLLRDPETLATVAANVQRALRDGTITRDVVIQLNARLIKLADTMEHT